MTVAELQGFLRSLSAVLAPNGGNRVATELNVVCDRLDAFSDYGPVVAHGPNDIYAARAGINSGTA